MSQYEAHVWDFFSDILIKNKKAQCLFCKEHTHSSLKFKKKYLEIHQCECGFVFLKNQPTDDMLSKFYEQSKALDTWADIKTSDFELNRQREKFSKAIDVIQSMSVAPEVLDLGCGNGVFLKLLREKLPRSVCMGVDSNISASKVAENSNSMIVQQDVYKFLKGPGGKFDWITLWGVLEHVADPHYLVNLLAEKLKPHGKVIVCVPNVNSLVVKTLGNECFTFCPQHLWYYSLENLKSIFSNFKFRESWTIEPEAKPIRRVTEGYKPYDPTRDVDLSTNITKDGKTYMDLPSYILDNNLGYKIVAVFQR